MRKPIAIATGYGYTVVCDDGAVFWSANMGNRGVWHEQAPLPGSERAISYVPPDNTPRAENV